MSNIDVDDADEAILNDEPIRGRDSMRKMAIEKGLDDLKDDLDMDEMPPETHRILSTAFASEPVVKKYKEIEMREQRRDEEAHIELKQDNVTSGLLDINEFLDGKTFDTPEEKIKKANHLIDQSLQQIMLHWPDAKEFIAATPTDVYLFLKTKDNLWSKLKKVFGNSRSIVIRKLMKIARKIRLMRMVIENQEMIYIPTHADQRLQTKVAKINRAQTEIISAMASISSPVAAPVNAGLKPPGKNPQFGVNLSAGDVPTSGDDDFELSDLILQEPQHTQMSFGKHDPKIRCAGCGHNIKDGNPIEFNVPFKPDLRPIFHDDLCVRLRKYKEIIRKMVLKEMFPSWSPQNEEDVIAFMLQKQDYLIMVDAQPVPRPLDDQREEVTHKSLTQRFQEAVLGQDNSRQSTEKDANLQVQMAERRSSRMQPASNIVGDLKSMRHERMLAVAIIHRDETVSRLPKNSEWKFAGLPILLYYLDCDTYGESIWEFLHQQLLIKQYKTLWHALAYVSMGMQTPRVVELLSDAKVDMSKVNDVDHLKLVMSSVIEASTWPIATALHMSQFAKECGEKDLSRFDEFKEIAEEYADAAKGIANEIESDHLLSIVLEAATDLNDMTTFEIASNFTMVDFFDSNRVERICMHMWSVLDLLNPQKRFTSSEMDFYTILEILLKDPSRFYFAPMGRFWSSLLMYALYLAGITWVVLQHPYPYKHIYLSEWVMWVCNLGYMSFELSQAFFDFTAYITVPANWFDQVIVWDWIFLGFVRFLGPYVWNDPTKKKYGFEYFGDYKDDELLMKHCDDDEDLSKCKTVLLANAGLTTIYMGVLAMQVIFLWVRATQFFRRNRSTGPFVAMIGGMIGDVFNFAIVLTLFMMGFMFSLKVIIVDDVRAGCGSEELTITNMATILLYVWQTLMGQQEWGAIDANDCMHGDRSLLAYIVIFSFSILGTTLLLNLLIALMASTYERKTEDKKKEFQFTRLEETYQLAHELALIPPPLNLIVIVSTWFIFYVVEILIYIVTCTKWEINVQEMFPFDLDYERDMENVLPPETLESLHDLQEEQELDTRARGCFGLLLERDETDSNPLLVNKKLVPENRCWCQYCRKEMMGMVGTPTKYFKLFVLTRLDKADTDMMAQVLRGVGLCPFCFRPFLWGEDGDSDRLYRYQVVQELVSYWIFLVFLWLPLGLFFLVPAMFSGCANAAGDIKEASSKKQAKLMGEREVIHSENQRILVRRVFDTVDDSEIGDLADDVKELQVATAEISKVLSDDDNGGMKDMMQKMLLKMDVMDRRIKRLSENQNEIFKSVRTGGGGASVGGGLELPQAMGRGFSLDEVANDPVVADGVNAQLATLEPVQEEPITTQETQTSVITDVDYDAEVTPDPTDDQDNAP